MKYTGRRVARFVASFVLVSIVFVSFVQGQVDEGPIVKTDAGLVSGAKNKNGDIHIFRGIPFAD